MFYYFHLLSLRKIAQFNIVFIINPIKMNSCSTLIRFYCKLILNVSSKIMYDDLWSRGRINHEAHDLHLIHVPETY